MYHRLLFCLLLLSACLLSSGKASSPSKKLRWSHVPDENRILTTNGTVISNVPDPGVTKRWSDPSTWDNSMPPGLNDDVLITGPGSVVELDVLNSPRLNSITIENGAKLVVADPAIVHAEGSMSLQLNVAHIHVMGMNSAFEAGSEAVPLQGRVSIRLYGTKNTPPLHGNGEAGNKAIFVHGGRLDFHGAPRIPTWTRLGATANAGSTSLVVQGEVDWKEGEEIAITSSDFDVAGFDEQFEAQQLTIVSGPLYDSVEDKTFIQIDQPLNYALVSVSVLRMSALILSLKLPCSLAT